MKKLLAFVCLCVNVLLAETPLILPNGDFEQQTPAWKLNAFCKIIPEAAHTGKLGLRIEDDSNVNGASASPVRIDVTPGTHLVVRFWGRSLVSGESTGIYIRFVDAKGTSLNSQKLKNDNITPIDVNASNWREHIALGKVPDNAAQLALWIHSANNSISKADLDDFTVAAVTEAEAEQIAKALPAKRVNSNGRLFPVPSAARIDEIAAMLPETPTGPCPPASDRKAWAPLLETTEAQNIIKKAVTYLGLPRDPLPDEAYLEFSQNGNRSHFEKLYFQRTNRLNHLVLAEALEYQGRFIKAVEEDIHAICKEKSWNLPAHDKELDNFYNRAQHAALFSSEIAANLAYADWWLGNRLSPSVREEIRREINRRIFQPYWPLVRTGVVPNGFWWTMGKNNWNAVCHDNLVRTALIMLKDRRERAEVIAGAENGMPYYVNGYSPDGYCTEGIGYWNYGYGHFLQLAETVLLATGGKLSFYRYPRLEKVAAYARDIQIEEGICPAFADCGIKARPTDAFLSYIQRRYPSAVFKAIPPQKGPTTVFASVALHCFYDALYPTSHLPQTGVFPGHSLFEDAGIYIGRSHSEQNGYFGTAFKAGHNGEEHNHNDIGSFTIVFNGTQYFLDPGGEAYTKQTFSKDRYKSQMLNSYGHMVPVVAGKLQTGGSKSCGKFVKTDFSPEHDVLVTDLKGAYRDVFALKSLTRTFTFDRTAPSVMVRDEVEFDTPQSFETCLVSMQALVVPAPTDVIAYNATGAVKASIAAEGGDLTMSMGEIVNPNRTAPKRYAIAFKEPVKRAAITVTFTPTTIDKEALPGFYHAPDMTAIKPDMARAVTVQAEDYASQTGGEIIVEGKLGADGKAFKQWNQRDHAISWNVRIPQDGRYAVLLRQCHISPEAAHRTLAMDDKPVANGVPFLLPGTGGWSNTEDNWRNVWLSHENHQALILPLTAGNHVLTMTNADNRGVNLDWIKFVPVP